MLFFSSFIIHISGNFQNKSAGLGLMARSPSIEVCAALKSYGPQCRAGHKPPKNAFDDCVRASHTSTLRTLKISPSEGPLHELTLDNSGRLSRERCD